MSERNVEIVERQFEALNRRDWGAVMAPYDEHVVLVVGAGVAPEVGIFRGRETVGRWFGDWFRAFGRDYRFEVEEVRTVGDLVLVVQRHRGRGRASGAEAELINAAVFRFRETKIVRLELHASRSEALAAMDQSD
jgi:ketosteroid isomerase-like protein